MYLINNRIGINFTYYDRITKDQIAPVSLPYSTGFSQLLTNFGVIQNKGIELGLQLTPFDHTSGFRWDIFGTFTHNKNVVLELADGVDEITILQGNVGGSPTYFSGMASAVLRPGQ